MCDKKKQYKVKANDFQFVFSENEIAAADLIYQSSSSVHLIHQNRSVNARILETDSTGKKLQVEVEGNTFDVEIKDELDQMLDVMGFGMTAAKQIKEIKAPMPGMVLEIAVLEGQEMSEGEKVLILGAMKMENSILIQTNARIKRVAVSVGQAVEKGQVMVELE